MKIHFGTGNISAEDYYYIRIGNSTASALGLGNSASPTHAGYTIARNLPPRPHWKPLMWRSRARIPSGPAWGLFPTACPTPSPTCPSKAQNLQAAESRISDVDVASEMTEFTRNQILVQAAVAMLAQANSLPQMALQLINGR